MLYQFDKANWYEAIHMYSLFLLLIKWEKDNTNNGTMTRRGYGALQVNYEQKTGLRHDLKQLKNRYGQLKQMYTFYKWANTQTTIGRLANGGIDAPISWWEKNTNCSLFCHLVFTVSIFLMNLYFVCSFVFFRRNQSIGNSCMIYLCTFQWCKSCSRILLLMALPHVSLDYPTLMKIQMGMRKLTMKLKVPLQMRKASWTVHLVPPAAAKGLAALQIQPQVQARQKRVPVVNIMLGLVTQLELASDKEVKTLKEILDNKKDQAKQAKREDITRCLKLVVESGAWVLYGYTTV